MISFMPKKPNFKLIGTHKLYRGIDRVSRDDFFF